MYYGVIPTGPCDVNKVRIVSEIRKPNLKVCTFPKGASANKGKNQATVLIA